MNESTALARLNELRRTLGECATCDSEAWDPHRFQNDAGQTTYPLLCATCGYRSSFCVPAKIINALALHTPELARKWDAPVCEVCGASGAADHHWAPYALFGDEADRWPRSFLCPPCHERWHKVVTPEISTAK